MKKVVFSEEDTNKIINLYVNENQALTTIGKQFNVTKEVIKRILQEQGIQLRKKTTKYYANYDVFENIDSPEKAYWLGFLAADGCVYTREKNAMVLININAKDISHLQKFKTFVNTNAEIKEYTTSTGFSNNTHMCKIVLNSVKMAQDLIDKGIVPRKSLCLQPPKISEEYFLPFILGYFDGDGSISKTSQYNNYSLQIVGTKELLTWINDLLNVSGRLEKRNPESDSNNYYIRCGGTNKPYQILYKLYNSCETKLDRKYNIYKELETVVLDRNIK